MGMKQVVALFFLLQVFLAEIYCKIDLNVEDSITVLKNDALDKWLHKNDLSLVLLGTDEVTSNFDYTEVLGRLHKIGERLNGHGVFVGVFDCDENKNSRCDKVNVELPGFAAYLQGAYLMHLPADSLFDNSSIISNVLELLLIREVPLVQSREDLTHQMKEGATKLTDFLIMFVKGVGSKEHAEYMEVARNAQDDDSIKYTFAHSTSQAILEGSNINSPTMSLATEVLGGDGFAADAMLYFAECSPVRITDDANCPMYRYLGKMDQQHISQFIQMLPGEDVVTRDSAILSHLPTLTCCYNDKTKDEMKKSVEAIRAEMRGSVLAYDIPVEECPVENIPVEHYGTSCHFLHPLIGDGEEYVSPENLRSYMVKALRDLSETKEAKDDDGEDTSAIDKLIEAVETIDDTIEIAENKLGGRLGGKSTAIFPNLVKLTRDTIDPEEFDGIVIFHLIKYDHRNRFIMRLFNEAAGQLTNQKLHMLDCYDWTDVCKKIKVHSFPTIRSYKKGKHLDYTGPRSIESFKRLAALSPYYAPHKMESMADMMEIRKTCVDSNLDILIGLFKDDDSKAYGAYKKAAQQLVGQKVMTVATGAFAAQIQKQFNLPSLPVVMSYNPAQHDPKLAIKLYDRPQIFLSAVVQFALKSTLPPLVELTPETLPVLFKTKKPQVLLFIDDLESDMYKAVEELAADKDVMNKFGFSYLTVTDKPINQRIFLSLSGGSEPPPSVLVADYKKGKVYQYSEDKDSQVVNRENLKKWLQQVSLGNGVATNEVPVGEWKPAHEGFDYLDLIEKDKLKKKQEHDRLNVLPKSMEAGEEDKMAGEEVKMADPEPIAEPETKTDTSKQAPAEHTEL